MTDAILPLIVEPDDLQAALGNPKLLPNLLIVDLCKADIYKQMHIPGAVHLEYGSIVAAQMPVVGLLPSEQALATALGMIGLTPDSHVVAYDDEGGGKAARLLWTLDVIGHKHYSLLDGGLHAWSNEGYPLDNHHPHVTPTVYPVRYDSKHSADRHYIQTHLHNPHVALLDARTHNEYIGADKRAQKNGHIPGAENMDWVLAIDQQHNLRLKPLAELQDYFDELGITADKEVIAYCHSHHRSSLLYIVLKALGYQKIKGYPGSWSDWGNAAETPVE